MKKWLEAKSGLSRPYQIAAASIVCLYLIAAFGCALTQRPWCDEAWDASPALSLITRGYMGTPVLDPESRWIPLTGIDRYTYWIMPLYPLSQAPWYKIFGFGVIQMRVYSMLWGLLALVAWFVIIKVISRDTRLALLTFALIAIDFNFIQRSSEGRPDTMSAALGFAGFAVYLTLRQKNLTTAIILSHTLVAASCFTHPNGLMPFLSLLFLTLYFDRSSLRWQHPLLAATPYLVGAACWGLYISRAPQFFKIQLSGNATGRFGGFVHPLNSIRVEIVNRYLRYLAGFAPDLSSTHRLKVIILITYMAGLIIAISVARIRRDPNYRVLFIITGIYLVVMTFWDGTKSPLYLGHILPLFAAILAISIRWCWDQRIAPRWVIGCWLLVFAAVQLGGVGYVIVRDTYGKTYKPAVAFLKQHADPHASIIGSSELGFDVGFFNNLTDDIRLGYVSGKKPDYIVVEGGYEDWFRMLSINEPKTYEFIRFRLSHEYHPVYVNPPFTIYAVDEDRAGVSRP